MSFARKFFTVSGLTIASRILGVVRESILVHFLGASLEMDAFTTAFKFPSFFRKFFAEGGFQSIFIPYYTDFIVANKMKGAKYFSSRILTIIFWIILFLTLIIVIFAKHFTILMAPGFVGEPEKLELATRFTQIISPSIAFVSLSTIYSGILLSRKKFFLFSLAPIFVNIILITTLVVGQDLLNAGYRISIGVLLAGIFQFFYMYTCVKAQRFPSPRLSRVHVTPKVKEFTKKLIPVLAGAGVTQVNVLVGSLFASFLPTGCITYLYCADRFVQLPLALFGISIGIILLPEIAEAVSRNQTHELKEIQNKSLLFTLRLSCPAVISLFALAYYMIAFLYGHGKFDERAVINTANVVKIAALGIPAYIIAKVMSSVFIAQKDSKTPVIAAIVSIFANMVFSILLMRPLQEIGLAISNALAGFVNVYILCRKSKGWFSFDRTVLLDILKILAASVVSFLAIIGIDHIINLELENFIGEMIHIIVGGFTCVVSYVLALFISKDKEVLRFIKKTKS